jgi:hypothetical protein
MPMTLSMSQASLPTFEITLNALSGVLEKAQAFAKARKIDDAVLLRSRLAPDIDAPVFEDKETTLAQLRERIAKTVAFLKTLDSKKIDAVSDKEIVFPLGPEKKGHMKGDDYLNHFVLPNFYFHCTAVYAILRHLGVEVGKQDFLGQIPIKVV